ncbi:MAG: AbiH family protein [Sphaerochaetaceae bacterium]|nr:AbiH family protein [Sphaerochaetaceae bacterium]
MNKIIIIGNGFDLAHGLKTSYHDFAENYLKKLHSENQGNASLYKDNLVEMKLIREFGSQSHDLFKWFEQKQKDIIQLSSFWKKIISNPGYGWVDIETEFFQHMLYLIDNSRFRGIDSINELNRSFGEIRKLLLKYLQEEETRKEVEPYDDYIDLFTEGVTKNDKIYFINFNYTSTADKYCLKCREKLNLKYSNTQAYRDNKLNIKFKCSLVNNIHGSLRDENIIFGIGDEYNERYVELKDSPYLHDILKYSKSFSYPLSKNYSELIRFIDTTPKNTMVEVYGHSCGLSDRTLLKYIFQHQNIKMIKLFYYKDPENFIKQSIDVWRHFDDSQTYRERLVHLEESITMPQFIT